MSKKNNKRPWWADTDYDDEPTIGNQKDLFGNTISQHSRRLEEDYGSGWDYDFDDYGYYRRDWGRQLSRRGKNEDKLGEYETVRNDFKSLYSGGQWCGYDYYRKPQLSYNFVKQLASGLASKYNIKVKAGRTWKSDLLKKELTYNPASLVYGTEAELLATLLHEIGKLSYCEHFSNLRSNYLTVYRCAIEVQSLFEDIRADTKILKDYESATDIYESAIPGIDKRIDHYREYGKAFRDIIPNVLDEAYIAIHKQFHINQFQFEQALLNAFGYRDPDRVQEKIAEVREYYENNGSVYEYCAELLRVMYDTTNTAPLFINIEKKIVDTEDAISLAKKQESSQDSLTMMDNYVFPHIEDLLKDYSNQNEKFKEMFPDMPAEIQESLFKNMQNRIDQMGFVNIDDDGNISVRMANGSGPTDSDVPPEWQKGEYKPIYESVAVEIKSLISKMTFIRRQENTVRYTHDRKRGKLNTKKLYKFATNNKRIFQEKIPNTDTISSFAFSVLLDVSGSMHGDRIVHAVRANAIFGEVFDALDVPFELIAFGDGAQHLKKFNEPFDSEKKEHLAGTIRDCNSGTNLHNGLTAVTIDKRPEKNKVVVVLSDGGVGDPSYLNRDFFEPWLQKKIYSMAFGIECYDNMQQLCNGNGKNLESASELPQEFVNVVNSLIKKK